MCEWMSSSRNGWWTVGGACCMGSLLAKTPTGGPESRWLGSIVGVHTVTDVLES